MAKSSKGQDWRSILRGEIAYYLEVSGYKKPELAKKLGICPASLYNKLSNPEKFLSEELRCLFKILGLDNETIVKIMT